MQPSRPPQAAVILYTAPINCLNMACLRMDTRAAQAAHGLHSWLPLQPSMPPCLPPLESAASRWLPYRYAPAAGNHTRPLLPAPEVSGICSLVRSPTYPCLTAHWAQEGALGAGLCEVHADAAGAHLMTARATGTQRTLTRTCNLPAHPARHPMHCSPETHMPPGLHNRAIALWQSLRAPASLRCLLHCCAVRAPVPATRPAVHAALQLTVACVARGPSSHPR